MRNPIKFILLVSLVMTLSACGRMGDLVPIKASQVASVQSTSSSYA